MEGGRGWGDERGWECPLFLYYPRTSFFVVMQFQIFLMPHCYTNKQHLMNMANVFFVGSFCTAFSLPLRCRSLQYLLSFLSLSYYYSLHMSFVRTLLPFLFPLFILKPMILLHLPNQSMAFMSWAVPLYRWTTPSRAICSGCFFFLFFFLPYLGVSEQDAVHVMRRVLDQLVVGVEDDEANLAVAQDTQFHRFLHQSEPALLKRHLDG